MPQLAVRTIRLSDYHRDYHRATPSDLSTLLFSAAGHFSMARLEPGWVGSGKAVNGYLIGATAFFYANKNGVLDPDEPWSLTDATAKFNVVVSEIFDTNGNGILDDDEGQWVIQGGIDSRRLITALRTVSSCCTSGWKAI